MPPVAIRVDRLSKRYRIGNRHAPRTFREVLASMLSTVARRSAGDRESGEFWALRDVSFEVRHGEAVGIVGRNGAGKSTLLKVLSRITEPTRGSAEVFGRISSLLEVGTGFHPELTGRENVYLNGAILGMKRREIDRRFDQIIHFAEVEQFVDTAVKHYSSGMYVRLAFAVAAHLDPEILVVDEVLAVGDVGFQSKCVEFFQELSEAGKTIILISHNLNIVKKVCDRAMLFDGGTLVASGDTAEIIGRYARLRHSPKQRAMSQAQLQAKDPIRWGNGAAEIVDVYTAADGKLKNTFSLEESLDVVIEFVAKEGLDNPLIGFVITGTAGLPILASNSLELGVRLGRVLAGRKYRASFRIVNSFGDGLYSVSCAVNNYARTKPYCRLEDVHTFEVKGRSSRGLIWPSHSLDFEEVSG